MLSQTPRLSRNGLKQDAASGKQQYNTNWCTSIILHTVPTHTLYIFACNQWGCTGTSYQWPIWRFCFFLPISVGLNIAAKINIIYRNSLCHGKAALYHLLSSKHSWGNSSFILEKKCYATRSHRNTRIANILCYNHTKMIIVESYKK